MVLVVIARFVALCRLRCGAHRYTVREVNSRCTQLVLSVVFMLYPGIGTRVFRTFKCKKIGDAWWLTADLSVKCWEGEHAHVVVLMGVCTVVYVVGVPIACALVLWRNQKLIRDPKQRASKRGQVFEDDYGSLFTSYANSYWYFESIEMLKKMALAGGLVLVAPGSSVQVLVGILVAL